MSPGAGGNSDDLALTLARIKAQNKGNLSKIQLDLLNWHKNVDKRYAWVVLGALVMVTAGCLGPYRVYSLIYAKVTSDKVYTREEASWPVSAIFTVENIFGPFVSIITYYISARQSMAIGGLLLALGNSLTGISPNLITDVILLGFVQGIGYAFIFMPLMSVVNDYFLKYRNLALGLALSGGTMSIFLLQPIFRYILEVCPWRQSYLFIGLICCIIIVVVPLLKPNTMPSLDELFCGQKAPPLSIGRKISVVSMRALSYRNSIRQQSTIMINRPSNNIQRQASVISINPFASTAGLERKISVALTRSNEFNKTAKISQQPSLASISQKSLNPDQNLDPVSLTEVDNYHSEFEWSLVWNVLKTPGFHLIWYNELIYFWVFSIYCLVMVDYGVDRGCTIEEAQSLLNYQSIGELIGRLVLTIIVDMRFLSNKNVVILVLLILTGLLVSITQVTTYVMLAIITVSITAFLSLLYILLNGLLVDFLGARQVTLGYGMASCIGGFLMAFRPQAVGYFRDALGTYDPLMICLAISCIIGALGWLLEPLMTKCAEKNKNNNQMSNCV